MKELIQPAVPVLVIPSINNHTNHSNNNHHHSNRNEQQRQRDGKQNDNDDHTDEHDDDNDHDIDCDVNDVLPCQFQYNYKQILLQQDDYDDHNNDDDDNINDDVYEQQPQQQPILTDDTMNATMMNNIDKVKRKDNDDNDDIPNQMILNYYTNFLQQQQYYDDLKHIDYTYIDYGYYYYTCNNNNIKSNNSNSHNGVVDSPTTTTTSTSTVELSPPKQEQQPRYTDYDIKYNTRCYYTPLIIQQSKHIPGKGGFCWDAAFILGEYITYQIIQKQSDTHTEKITTTTMIELGCGTGICGMYIAKSLLQIQGNELQQQQQQNRHYNNEFRQSNDSMEKQYKQLYHITITDMDGPIQDLIHHNLLRNFDHSYHYHDDNTRNIFYYYFQQYNYPLCIFQQQHDHQQQEQHPCNCNEDGHKTTGTTTTYAVDTIMKPLPQHFHDNDNNDTIIHPCCTINRMVLDWDDCYDKIYKNSNNNNDNNNNNKNDSNDTVTSHETQTPKTYDIVFGSDIVASIYDPIKLAYTVHSLCHKQSIVYISYKERLSTIHTLFHDTLIKLFHHVTIFNTVSSKIILTTSPEKTTNATTLHDIDIHNRSIINEEAKELSSIQRGIIDDADTNHHHHLKLPWTNCSNQNPNVYIIIAHSKKFTNTNISNNNFGYTNTIK